MNIDQIDPANEADGASAPDVTTFGVGEWRPDPADEMGARVYAVVFPETYGRYGGNDRVQVMAGKGNRVELKVKDAPTVLTAKRARALGEALIGAADYATEGQ